MGFLKPQMTLKNCKLNTVGEMELKQEFLTKYIGPVAIANNAKEKRFHTDRKKRNIVAGMTCL